MKKTYLLGLFILSSFIIHAQDFQWASSYDISNSNEVAALTISSANELYACGVHDADIYLPYNGDVYVLKTDLDGNEIWTKYLEGDIILSDMAAAGDAVVIMGQSNGIITYEGNTYGTGNYFMFLIKISSDGIIEWFHYDVSKYGDYGEVHVDQDKIAIHVRGQSNLGDHVQIFDFGGNLLQERLISSNTTIGTMAFYNNHVYINGFSASGEVFQIDDIIINPPSIENACFTISLNENLEAEWAHVDSTINNFDAKVVVDQSGIYVCETVIRPVFEIKTYLKKLNFDGDLLGMVEPPFFSFAVASRPDLAITDEAIAIFVQNDFDFNSHKVMLFDHDLELMAEKVIDGESDLYSGQITTDGVDFFVGHVHTGDLNFDGDITLDAINSDKHTYMAKLNMGNPSGLWELVSETIMAVYPNPSKGILYLTINGDEIISDGNIFIYSLDGLIVRKAGIHMNSQQINLQDLANGQYILHYIGQDGKSWNEKFTILR